jgi:signal transduction histidine kinase
MTAERAATNPGAATSFWRFNLNHELGATLLASLALLAGSWFSSDQLQRRSRQLHQADVERVGQLLQEHLSDAGRQLDRFATLPRGQQQRWEATLMLQPFSDVYRLNADHEIKQILTASPGSRVFAGFSFSASPLRRQLELALPTRSISSPISRSHEDEKAGVYLVRRDGNGQHLLARVKITYLQDFLDRYSRSSGLPLLLMSHDGFVMLASQPARGVAALDLSRAAQGQGYAVRHRNQLWHPVVADDNGLGGHFVSLIPQDQWAQQRQLVLLPSAAVGLLALLLFGWKNRRLHQQLFAPVARFTSDMEQLRSSLEAPVLPPRPRPQVAARFREMGQIQAGFEALMQAIRERDLNLQQKLRTSLTAAAIAHEINLPLSTIRLRCQQADQQLQRGPLDPDQTRELVQTLQAESQQVSRVIERMRMLLRSVQTELTPTDLVGVVQGALTLIKRPLREQQVQLSTQGLGGTRLIVMADAVQLQMALGNLLRNAIEAMAQQPPAQRQLLVSLQRHHDSARITVADSGPGFGLDPDADTLLRTTKPGGTGLGLFVARTSLTNHHGQLTIERSAQLGGASFTMVLPLAQNSGELPTY